MEEETTGIHQSKDYGSFTLIEGNRLVNKKHVQELIKSFETTPDIARTHPILVNEKLDIIDGQHRFLAWQALKWPIYYIQEKGLSLLDALRLNSNQKAWKIEDYARAYATSGNVQYQQFLELMEEYPLPYGVLQAYCEGYRRHGGTQLFTTGKLRFMKDRKQVRQNIERYLELREMVRGTVPQSFAWAMLEAFKDPKYNHDHFTGKFKLRGEIEVVHFHGNRNDWLRVIENIYNFYTPPADQIRLF